MPDDEFQASATPDAMFTRLRAAEPLIMDWRSEAELGYTHADWARFLVETCTEAGITVRVVDLEKKEMTVAYDNANEPPEERIHSAVRAQEVQRAFRVKLAEGPGDDTA